MEINKKVLKSITKQELVYQAINEHDCIIGNTYGLYRAPISKVKEIAWSHGIDPKTKTAMIRRNKSDAAKLGNNSKGDYDLEKEFLTLPENAENAEITGLYLTGNKLPGNTQGIKSIIKTERKYYIYNKALVDVCESGLLEYRVKNYQLFMVTDDIVFGMALGIKTEKDISPHLKHLG